MKQFLKERTEGSIDLDLLVGPGVVFSAGLTGVLVYYTFPYQWSWVQCFLFGGVLSATDPVAVAAILSEANHCP